MRKAFVIIIAFILLIGVSGCESLRAEYEASSTPDTEASAAPDVISEADIENAVNITTAINAYNALNPSSVLPDNVTPEIVKEALGEQLWPKKITDEEAKAAWKLIAYKDGMADLTPEAKKARKAIQASAEEKEQAMPGVIGDAQKALKQANACNIATSINAYNALNPNEVLPDDITLEEAKETLDGDGLWPNGLSDEQASEAWELIVYKNGAAEIKEED